MSSPPVRRFLTRPTSWPEARHLAEALRTETVGGVLLLSAAVVAVIWANSPWQDAYDRLQHLTFGPSALHLDLDLAHWASDGLLAIFFFIAGLELKRELGVGELSDPQRAVLPVAAALAGVAVPAAVYLVATVGMDGVSDGWAVPTATDIAFALAVLAVIGSHLPSGLRAFLLTLAVVDDLVAITIIALFFTDELTPLTLALAIVPLAAFGFLVKRRWSPWWLTVPLALLTWGLVHASGVHATVAGVALALTVPVRARNGEEHAPADHLEHRVRPISAGLAVPLFALLSAGVTIGGGKASWNDALVWAVVLALVVGKFVGILGGTWLTARFTRAELDDKLAWSDVAGVALLGGIGFTVSLLVSELAFGDGTATNQQAKLGVLIASVLSALAAAIVLRRRERVYREIAQQEALDSDADGVPDVYESEQQER
jgi:NhaA family Na+:H+ antiporter